MKINCDEAKKIQISEGLTLNQVFDSGDFDFVIAELNGSHRKFINKTSDRIYYFLEGEAFVSVGGEAFSCRKNDLVLIPKNTQYGLAGKARFIKITSPPFSPASEKVA